jgi:ribonuclease HI
LNLRIYTDGGARGNPGPSAHAVVVCKEDDFVLYEKATFLGNGTNNEAEYKGLLAGLKLARDYHAERVEVTMDSELVVKQMNGQYRVKAKNLQPLHQEARRLMQEFDSVTFTHVRRSHPMISRADELLNREMDANA